MSEAADRLRFTLGRPVDAAGLLVLRSLLGLLFAFSALRFLYKGWAEPLYIEPAFRFPYTGFGWVPEPSAPLLYGLLGLMVASGLSLAAGFLPRLSALAFFLAFSWVELLDKATYLNHYYLVSLLALLFVLLPPRPVGGRVPAWTYILLRGQVGLVYLYAGLAKLNADWLLRGEPLFTWLRPRIEIPLVGPFLDEPVLAIAMSWAGALYDLSIPFLLCLRRSRPYAFLAVIGFHILTWLLFPIGIFPWLMILLATIFFSPSWPRRFLRLPSPAPVEPRPAPRAATALVLGWLALQALIPLRFLLSPGEVAWTERGFRFSWRVMLIEKTGLVEYRILDRQTGRTEVVHPRRHLSPLQYKQMSTQPDMIAFFARHLAEQRAARGQPVAVFADAWASLNGRPSQRLIDPTVDLSRPPSELPPGWILPLQR